MDTYVKGKYPGDLEVDSLIHWGRHILEDHTEASPILNLKVIFNLITIYPHFNLGLQYDIKRLWMTHA